MTEQDSGTDGAQAADARESQPLTLNYTRIQTIATYTYFLGYTIPLAVTSTLALLRGEMLLGYTLGAFAVIALLIFWHVYRRGLGLGARVFLVSMAAVLFLYLVLSGGHAGTGLFWCFAMFVVIYHFSRAITGLLVNLALIMTTAVLLLSPVFAEIRPDYGAAIVSRFLVTGTITCILLFFYAMMQQVLTDSLKETQQQLLHVSMTDELTGLTNRRSMKHALQYEDHRDHGDRVVAIAIADVDHFKHINDTLGHDAGDHVLRHIAEVMRNALRKSDHVARWGGEEFLLLLDVLDQDEAVEIAERVRTTLESSTVSYNDVDVSVTVSFGVKVVADSSEHLQDAIVTADKNLLRAKESGRNRVIVS